MLETLSDDFSVNGCRHLDPVVEPGEKIEAPSLASAIRGPALLMTRLDAVKTYPERGERGATHFGQASATHFGQAS